MASPQLFPTSAGPSVPVQAPSFGAVFTNVVDQAYRYGFTLIAAVALLAFVLWQQVQVLAEIQQSQQEITRTLDRITVTLDRISTRVERMSERTERAGLFPEDAIARAGYAV